MGDLASIRTFPQLVKYLRDELDWPITSDDFEDLTFDYTPKELGIDDKNAAKIEKIKRLRALSVNQPWGVFFVKFEPKRLPIVALRRILSSVALKRRVTANMDDRKGWEAEDLLFISNYGGDGDGRQITFAHFSEDPAKHDLPTLKVLGWDNLDTPLHIDHVADSLRDHLRWPNDETDVLGWRSEWRRAFALRYAEVVTTSRSLAIRLAELARAIRNRINTALEIETDEGPLTTLMQAFRESLVHDLDADGFADMYAQTIAYGLLSARIASPKAGTADDLVMQMPASNPFLKELMETFLQVGGRRGTPTLGTSLDFDELGISEVVDLLDHARMDAVLRDFGDRNPQDDPVIHFYELFLKEYDAKKRMQRGVFYTPRPIVSYIVRSVHELLKTVFGLPDGLADVTTWGEMATRHVGIEIPVGAKPSDSFVTVLDPATGTGTFLVETIDVIYATLAKRWKQEGNDELQICELWNEYVPNQLLPRLYGYELLMAPYAIAHLKVGLKLYETGYRFDSQERTRIYLTNALEPAHDYSDRLLFAIPALAHEAKAVNAVKRTHCFAVVMGNPPYSVSSWNTGEWISALTNVYKGGVRAEESQIQSLSNDYIKFVRFAEWQLERSVGVLGLITGHGYLYGTQPRDLRKHLNDTLDATYCLDLHGSIRREGAVRIDDPVFQIMTGVAITVGYRLQGGPGMTTLSSCTGPLQTKFDFLASSTAQKSATGMPAYRPQPPNYLFAASGAGEGVDAEYQTYVDLPQIFGTANRQADKEMFWATGSATQQDDLAISFSRAELDEKMAALAESNSAEELRERFRLCTTDQWNYALAREFARSGEWRDWVGQIAYRPFDRRWTVYHRHVLTILRRRVMGQLTGNSGHNVGLVASRAVNDREFAHCFVTKEPVDKIFLSSRTSTNAYVFPLFFAETGDLYGRTARLNLSRTFLGSLAKALGISDIDEDGVPKGLEPRGILCSLYAILHSTAYRHRYAEALKIDFPRLPLPAGLDLYHDLARLGSELMALHLMESPRLDEFITTTIDPHQRLEVRRVGWSEDTVWLDTGATKQGHGSTSGTTGFCGVPEAVWNLHIGGYQVCEKWLKDRKGRVLAAEDIAHYQQVVVALSETIHLASLIDKTIEAHGGWPSAFSNVLVFPHSEARPPREDERYADELMVADVGEESE